MRFGAVLFSALCGLAVIAPGQPALARHAAKHGSAIQTKQALAFNQVVLDAEVLLDRAGFSPGTIDGRDGENFSTRCMPFRRLTGYRSAGSTRKRWSAWQSCRTRRPSPNTRSSRRM